MQRQEPGIQRLSHITRVRFLLPGRRRRSDRLLRRDLELAEFPVGASPVGRSEEGRRLVFLLFHGHIKIEFDTFRNKDTEPAS